jgi:hypothetical protein
MKVVRWDPLKNEWLKRERGVSFEDILEANYMGEKQHPSRTYHKLKLFEQSGVIWVVPYVENEQEVFLKTVYRSRKYTKAYHRGELG